MFRRAHHNRIAAALNSLNTDFFLYSACWFGGGTAIVLALNEYRESVDIYFLCASTDGYRLLRQRVFEAGFAALVRAPVALRRDLRADQYGLRAVLEVDGEPIKFEIVREARVPLSGALNPSLGVPQLSREDMYAEKLLANADRWSDPATLSRDVIDLSMMMAHWGPVPDAAWAKAEGAYGPSVRVAFARAVERIADRAWLGDCMARMSMDPALIEPILSTHARC